MIIPPLGWGFLGAIILGIIAWVFYSSRKLKEKVPDLFVTALLFGTLGVIIFVLVSVISLHTTTSIYRIRHVTFVHWLGDAFDDDEPLTILEICLSDRVPCTIHSTAPFEAMITQPIAPTDLRWYGDA